MFINSSNPRIVDECVGVDFVRSGLQPSQLLLDLRVRFIVMTDAGHLHVVKYHK
jgi:hypothetical protein